MARRKPKQARAVEELAEKAGIRYSDAFDSIGNLRQSLDEVQGYINKLVKTVPKSKSIQKAHKRFTSQLSKAFMVSHQDMEKAMDSLGNAMSDLEDEINKVIKDW